MHDTLITETNPPASPSPETVQPIPTHSGAGKYIRPSRRITLANQLAFNISQDSISAALCSHFLGRRKLTAVRKVYIPRDLTSDEHRAQFITGAIDDLYHEMGGRWKSVALTISGPETAYRRLILPNVNRGALNAAISFEAKRQLPFPVNDCYVASRPIARVQTESASKLTVALIAGTKRLIAQHLAPFQTLNIQVDAVYLANDVVGRLLEGLPRFDPESNYCLVNIERTRSEIAYYRGTELEFCHVISLGSQFLANRRDDTVFTYFTESLVNELQNSLDFYSGQYATRFSNQVYIYGDLSYTDDVINRLSSHFEFSFLRFPIETIRAFDHNGEDVHSGSPVCLPVVAAAVNNLAIPNLLPDEAKATLQAQRTDRWSISALGIMAALLVALWTWSHHVVSDYQTKLTGLKSEVEQFRVSELYTNYENLKGQMAIDQAYLAKAKATPGYLSATLKELSILTPPEVRVYDFVVSKQQSDKNGRLAGVVHSAAAPPELVLAEFVERLRQSQVFSQVTVDSYQKKSAAAGFDLFFQLTMVGRI